MTMWALLSLRLRQWCYGWRQQRDYLENINHLLAEGVPIHHAVETVRAISHGSMQVVAQSSATQLAQGHCFADGLQGWYAPETVAMIRAGEMGGAFKQTLLAAQRALKGRHRLWVAAAHALAYPCVVLLMAVLVAVFIQHSVLQSFAQIKPMAVWPPMGRSLNQWAVFFERWGWLVLLMLVVGLWWWRHALRSWVGSMRVVVDRWPVWSLYRRVVAAQLAESLGLMLQQGVSMREALTVCQVHATPYVAWHLDHMVRRLGAGQDNLADVLGTGLLSRNDLLQLRVLAKGRDFAQALVHTAARIAQQAEMRVMIGVRVLAALLLVVAAAFAGYMVLAVYGVGGMMAF